MTWRFADNGITADTAPTAWQRATPRADRIGKPIRRETVRPDERRVREPRELPTPAKTPSKAPTPAKT